MALPPISADKASFTLAIRSSPVFHDPFWQSVPSVIPGSLSALMTAVQQAVPIIGKAPAAYPVSPTQTLRRPQCTHMTMERIHGHQICLVCGKKPSLGFLYHCREDAHQADLKSIYDAQNNEREASDQITHLAASSGVSESVLNQIRLGIYTDEQVARLVAQRQHVISTIERVDGVGPAAPVKLEQTQNHVNARSADDRSDEGLSRDAEDDVSTDSHSQDAKPVNVQVKSIANNKQAITVKGSPCTFRVCHTCRPIFRDRLYTSIGAVLDSKGLNDTTDDPKNYTVLDASVLRTIALRKPAVRSYTPPDLDAHDNVRRNSLDIATQASRSFGGTSTPSSSEYSGESSDDNERLPCPGAGVCPVWSRQSGCAYDSGFDDGCRATNHSVSFDDTDDPHHQIKEQESSSPFRTPHRFRHLGDNASDTPNSISTAASSISLPTPTINSLPRFEHNGFPSVGDAEGRLKRVGKASTVCGILDTSISSFASLDTESTDLVMRAKHSSSSLGSEVAVEGGVALTEEAVETGMPDILTTD